MKHSQLVKLTSFKKLYFIALLLQGLAGPGSTAKAQEQVNSAAWKEIGAPPIQNYDPEEYDANPMNWGIVRDLRGLVYAANLDGVLEFDGVSWRLIETPKGTWVLSLARDSTGTVYVGSFGEFGYLAPDSLGQMQFVSLLEHVEPDDRDFSEVWRTHCTTAGAFFRARDRLFLWSSGKMSVLKSKSTFSLSSVVDDTLYVEDRGTGLMKTAGDSLILIPDSQRFQPMHFSAILPFDHNRKLVCTTEGLLLFDGSTFSPFATAANAFLRENGLSSAVALPGGKFAIGTYRAGACIIDRQGRILQVLNSAMGLRNEDVKNLYCDTRGTLWLSLNSGIAQARVHDPVSFFTERRGLKGNVVSVARHNNILYAATSQAVFYLDTGEAGEVRQGGSPDAAGSKIEMAMFRPVQGIPNQGFWLLPVDGKLLVATSTEGVYEIDGEKAFLVNSTREGAFVLYRSINDSSVVYIGLKKGLEILKLQDQQWVSTGRVKGIDEEIRTIAEEEDGTLWLGTIFQGVFQVRLKSYDSEGWDAEVERFGKAHGLPDGPANISRINGKVVFATRKGHRRFDPVNKYFPPDSSISIELADTTLFAAWVEEDRFGRVFFWPQNDAGKSEVWMAQPGSGGYSIDKTKFRSIANFGLFHTTYTDRDSVIWIGCSNGLVRYDPGVTNQYRLDHPALIRRVATIRADSLIYGGNAFPQFGTPLLAHGDNALRFEYTLPTFEDQSENRYQYFLDGFDDGWSQWTKETRKDYTNLSGGKYVFKVRARNTYGDISEEAAFSFKILAPWYLRWWAYATYLVFLFAAIYSVHRIQRSRLLKRELQRAKIREAAIIREKNVELQNTNRQLAEVLEKLQIAQNALIESESRFRSVAESANDAIITADRTGHIAFWNQCAEAIFGYSEKEAVGQPLTILMPDRHREAHRKGIARFHQTGQGQIIGQVTELQAVRKDGTEFPIELTLAAWETYDGKFVTGIVRDITKRKQEQEELEKTQVRLFQSEKLASLGKLTAGIAHEINTPLGAIKSNADVANRCIARLEEIVENEQASSGLKQNGEYMKFVEILKENSRTAWTASERITKIINSLKNFTKLDESHFKKVDINENIESTLTLIEHEVKEGVTVIKEYGELPLIGCYPGELNQVFMHLLVNAAHAILKEGAITIRTFMENDAVNIEIADTGVGIPLERMKDLFNPGFSEAGSRIKAGLGLYTSYNIVQKHQGQLKVESTVGKGSTFTVILPASL